MPYYVFNVKPFAQLEQQAEFALYKEAAAHARQLRALQSAPDKAQVRVIFADTPLAAEDLLLQVRTPAPTGDE
jgi:hypothetical protein